MEHPEPQSSSKVFLPCDREQQSLEVNASISLDTPPQIFTNQYPDPIISKYQSPHIKHDHTSIILPYPSKAISFQKNTCSRSRHTTKKRAVITEQLLSKINESLKFYTSLVQSHQQKKVPLKAIAKELNLGYRTILAKYKQFKDNKIVIGGQGLNREPKNYPKTQKLISTITKSINIRRFKTTQELCDFISQTYEITYKRARVAKYYSKLKFKNVMQRQYQENLSKEKIQVGIQALRCLRDIMQSNFDLIYFSEQLYDIANSANTKLRVMVMCGKTGFLYKYFTPYSQDSYYLQLSSMLTDYLQRFNLKHNWLLVSTVKHIYEGLAEHARRNRETPSLLETIVRLQGKLFCLPEGYQRFNPAMFYVQIGGEAQHCRQVRLQQLEEQFYFYKRSFSSTFAVVESRVRQQSLKQEARWGNDV